MQGPVLYVISLSIFYWAGQHICTEGDARDLGYPRGADTVSCDHFSELLLCKLDGVSPSTKIP